MRDDLHRDLTGADDAVISSQAYRDWATCEALTRVLDKPYDDAILILEDFRLEMLACSVKFMEHCPPVPINPFSIIFDQVETLLAMLESPKE